MLNKTNPKSIIKTLERAKIKIKYAKLMQTWPPMNNHFRGINLFKIG